jgi:hypothetical protein
MRGLDPLRVTLILYMTVGCRFLLGSVLVGGTIANDRFVVIRPTKGYLIFFR